MDCNPPGSSVLGISQARILERAAISSSRGLLAERSRASFFLNTDTAMIFMNFGELINQAL